MREAREKISLEDWGMTHLAMKQTRNGSLLCEFPRAGGHVQADVIARELQEIMGGVAVVARPVKRGEIRVVGLDDSATPQEVARALRVAVERPETDFQVGEIRRSAMCLGALWVRCPLESVLRLEKLGWVQVGWLRVRIQLMRDRPLQCFKCLVYGHLAFSCRSNTQRVSTSGVGGPDTTHSSAPQIYCGARFARRSPRQHGKTGTPPFLGP